MNGLQMRDIIYGEVLKLINSLNVAFYLVSQYPNWTHVGWCRTSDPINIIFKGIPIVSTENELRSNGWNVTNWYSAAFDQFIPFHSAMNKTKQNIQLTNGKRYQEIPYSLMGYRWG